MLFWLPGLLWWCHILCSKFQIIEGSLSNPDMLDNQMLYWLKNLPTNLIYFLLEEFSSNNESLGKVPKLFLKFCVTFNRDHSRQNLIKLLKQFYFTFSQDWLKNTFKEKLIPFVVKILIHSLFKNNLSCNGLQLKVLCPTRVIVPKLKIKKYFWLL